MSIRLDPRRLGTLKQLAAEAGTRPGELVRVWVEERIDAERRGEGVVAAPGGGGLALRLDELAARVAALEARNGGVPQPATAAIDAPTTATKPVEPPAPATPDDAVSDQPGPASASGAKPAKKRRARSASAKPSTPRVGLHDEMIAVIAERGPMTASDLAKAITERGRYTPPRSGKPLDAAMVSQRVSNPVYRSRFRRSDGRIGLAEAS
jgi:hypothetical protein